jgi:hypothetical protein
MRIITILALFVVLTSLIGCSSQPTLTPFPNPEYVTTAQITTSQAVVSNTVTATNTQPIVTPTVVAPPPPTSLSPGSTNIAAPWLTTNLTPTFQWNNVAAATSYVVGILQLTGTEWGIIWVSTPITGTSVTTPSGILKAGGIYCWRMASINPAGQGENSTPIYFSVQNASPPAST